jgi:glycosyltransferase involved in cell wall biosynthesis
MKLIYGIFFLIKMITILSIISRINYLKKKLKLQSIDFNDNYIKLNLNLNLTFYNINKRNNKINIAIYAFSIKNGGRSRITALLINYLYRINIFKIFLFTLKIIEEDEYIIPVDIKRFQITNHLIKIINKNKIDILIYELDEIKEIIILNNYKSIKVIYYQHSSSFDWLYENYTIYKSIYEVFYSSKYIVSIVPFDNDYLFNKWGLSTILMENFMTHEFDYVLSSDLSTKTILLIGRGFAKKKRFHIGIEALEYIIKEIPNCELIIISKIEGIGKLQKLVNNLDLENNIRFNGYASSPDIYFRNASLNIIPSISEAFPMVLSETKIYGIPNIILGLDYIFNAKGGTIIIYDDHPESLASEAIKIIEKTEYRKQLGKESRKSMKKFKNDLVLNDWIELILSIYKGQYYYNKLREDKQKLSQNDLIKILNNQIKLLKMRYKIFQNITKNEFENFTYMKNIKFSKEKKCPFEI